MGFESCVLINHDLYHTMADKPAQFVRDLWHAINARGNPTRFSMGTVVYTDHAAGTHLVATGGHLGADLALVSDRNPLDAAVQLELLKLAADKLGYKLTKKPSTQAKAKKKTAKKASSSRKDTDGKTPAKGHKRTRKGTSGG